MSLIVGGIGIMNIMLVSVTERTREIGIRLAIGALEHEVLLQFLIEAVVLSSLGGLIGIALATAASIGLSSVMNIPYLFNPAINLLSFAISAGIGVVFGFFPRAAPPSSTRSTPCAMNEAPGTAQAAAGSAASSASSMRMRYSAAMSAEWLSMPSTRRPASTTGT